MPVLSKKDLPFIFQYFDRFGLITHKGSDFLLLKQVFQLIQRKEHLSLEGLLKIVAIKASMNQGLSEKLKLAKNPPHRGGVFVKF